MDGAPQFDRASRDQAFGYECRRCLRCRRHKRIQLNPYEVARLAYSRSISTTAFRTLYTVDGRGVELAQAPNGDCVFLGPEGCTVHPDRPLVCRLYPLGRFVSFDGTESFRPATPHPDSEGVYHDRGAIADFLEAQGAEPFIRAADAYMAWLTRAVEVLSAATGRSPDAVLERTGPERTVGDERLLDLDAAVAEHCAASGTREPADPEARCRLHLSILHLQLETEEGASDGV
jgi:hypothetical protein